MAQSHKVLDRSTIAFRPNWMARINWLGARSKCSATGQPDEHFWHW
jgi:hypothetical protein